jgi:hypothetical protein
MAFTPCAFHGAKYSGGASTFFLRLVKGGDARGGKLQVCPNCAVLTLEYLSMHAIKVSEGDSFVDYADPIGCMNCGGDVQTGSLAFYGNAYPRGRVETQWYAKCCPACADAVADDLHLDAGRVRA